MNSPLRLVALLFLAGAVWCQSPAISFPLIEIRLMSPLTSYGMAPGAPFQGVVTAPANVEGRLVLPAGTLIHGTVRKAVGVGIGLVHERATLDLDFNEYELADGRRFPLRARLTSIDNARESVTREGQIKGILAASNPQSFITGLWMRPTISNVGRSLAGLTGAGGRLWTEFSMGPFGAAALFAARLAIFRLPEPEIQLPPGTEMTAELTSLAEDAPAFAGAAPAAIPDDLSEWLLNQPFLVKKPDGQTVSDIVNIALIGSREQLLMAFTAAGWSQPDRLTTRSFVRAYKAYTSQAGYAAAPVSKLLYLRDEPDFIFQKSLNTIAKRHHVRIWDAELNGQLIWLAAATQDTGIALSSRRTSFTHTIEPALDLERHKVLRDLGFAGCVQSTGYVERESAVRTADTRSRVESDGGAAIVRLRDCALAEPPANARMMPPAPGSLLSRMARRTLLETRQYLLRGNAYYWAYRGLRYGHQMANPASQPLTPNKSLTRPELAALLP
ncbi:MAG TPA: LssY C-terminal domain-containing protein [Bryobacteraceae bacterium]|nr:LssY C-terminal domain-containing protein [Bryobacteraceae bacterium]